MEENFVAILLTDNPAGRNNEIFELLAGNYLTKKAYENLIIIYTSEDPQGIYSKLKTMTPELPRMLIIKLTDFYGNLPLHIWNWVEEKKPGWITRTKK